MESAKNQWMKDITIFKDQCNVNTKFTDDDSPFVDKMKKDLDDDVMSLEEDN